MKYQSGKRLAEVKDAILRLVELHGRGITHESAVKLTLWSNPDGKYLIKGGGPKVWRKFRLRKEHRRLQGIIHGKRCGTTENIGPAARQRLRDRRGASGDQTSFLKGLSLQQQLSAIQREPEHSCELSPQPELRNCHRAPVRKAWKAEAPPVGVRVFVQIASTSIRPARPGDFGEGL